MSNDPGDKPHFLAWEQEYSHVKWGGPRSIEDIRERLPAGSRVLDAGCGNGRHLLPLSSIYFTVGIDVSFTALESARSYLEKSGRYCECAISSITHIPFTKESFDAIVCFGVLQHLLERERADAVREFERVLRPGGLVFFEAFGIDDMRYGGEPVEQDTFMRKNGIVYHYFTKEELVSLFEGFRKIDLRDMKKQKRFRGESYTRHMIRTVFQKAIPR